MRDSVYYDSTRQHLFIDVEIDEGLQYRLGPSRLGRQRALWCRRVGGEAGVAGGDGIWGARGQSWPIWPALSYYEKGYLDTRVVPQETIRNDSIDVSFQVFEGQPWTIRKVEIAGNTKTREKVIRREIELRPGDIYQQNLVQESQRRIMSVELLQRCANSAPIQHRRGRAAGRYGI